MAVVWERLTRRTRGAVAPAELRALLPLLWPAGPTGPLDVEALRALSRDYARSGRTLQDLLDDIDGLCDVVGIGVPSRILEASCTAWSDGFLDTVDPDAPRADLEEQSLREVEQHLAAYASRAWDGVPSGRLLVAGLTGHLAEHERALAEEELTELAAEVRRLFPHAPVAVQTGERRVVAAVTEVEGIEARIARLEAYCSERPRSAPTVETRPVPDQLDRARGILRTAG